MLACWPVCILVVRAASRIDYKTESVLVTNSTQQCHPEMSSLRKACGAIFSYPWGLHTAHTAKRMGGFEEISWRPFHRSVTLAVVEMKPARKFVL